MRDGDTCLNGAVLLANKRYLLSMTHGLLDAPIAKQTANECSQLPVRDVSAQGEISLNIRE
jgi:hypothetical protein